LAWGVRVKENRKVVKGPTESTEKGWRNKNNLDHACASITRNDELDEIKVHSRTSYVERDGFQP
jgi:hypothetical protein